MNYTRNDLIQAEATMNQLRNAIYHLARFIENSGEADVIERLRNMGRKIARTFINYWKPIDFVNLSILRDVLTTIYQKIVNSTVSIVIDDNKKIIIVKDTKCALCKYHYKNVNIAGCEILLGMVSEFINLINKESSDSTSVFLEPYQVVESRALGNEICIQVFKFNIGGG